MSFDALSNELVAEIFSHLLPKDLTATSRCSKRFQAVAEPTLYSTFTQTGQLAIPQFLRTLHAKRYLLQYVRHLHVSDAFTGIDLELLEEFETQKWMRESLLNDMGVGAFSDYQIHPLFSSDNWEPLVGLFLVLFSNKLRSFNLITYRGLNAYIHLPKFFVRAYKEQKKSKIGSFLSRLEQVNISCDEPAHWLGLDLIYHFLKLPSVLDVRIAGVANKGLKKLRVFHTTDLSLTSSRLCSKFLRPFLQCFTSLKRFEYEQAFGEDLVPSAVVTGLCFSQNTLEEMVLRHSDKNWGTDETKISQSLGPLTEFTSLKTLDADAKILIGCEYADLSNSWESYTELHYTQQQVTDFPRILPRSLEHLIIRSCTKAIFDCLPELFLLNENLPPKLMTVKLVFERYADAQEDPEIDWVEAALNQGVVLTRHWSGGSIDKGIPQHVQIYEIEDALLQEIQNLDLGSPNVL